MRTVNKCTCDVNRLQDGKQTNRQTDKQTNKQTDKQRMTQTYRPNNRPGPKSMQRWGYASLPLYSARKWRPTESPTSVLNSPQSTTHHPPPTTLPFWPAPFWPHSNKNRLKHFTIAFWNCSNIFALLLWSLSACCCCCCWCCCWCIFFYPFPCPRFSSQIQTIKILKYLRQLEKKKIQKKFEQMWTRSVKKVVQIKQQKKNNKKQEEWWVGSGSWSAVFTVINTNLLSRIFYAHFFKAIWLFF